MLSVKAVVSIAGIAGVVMLGQLVGLVYQHGRITTLDAKLETEQERTSRTREACAIAQAGDVKTIEALRTANAQCAAARDQVAAAGAAAVDQAERDRRAGWAHYYTLQRELESLYAEDADCRAWADQPVCAAVAERLHDERAAAQAPAD